MSKIYDVLPSLSSLSLNSTGSRSASLRQLLPPSLQRLVLLSYPIQQPPLSTRQTGQTLYGKGPADIAFTLFCALTFTLLRALVMRYILGGFARWYLVKRGGRAEPGWKGKKERKRREHIVQRFSEQGWSFLYCTYSWSLGFYILSLLPSPLSPETLWSAYPHTPLPSLTKYYYLSQLGWWFHQIYVINTEKRRHDHWQMFSHHILTICLVGGSYVMNWTRVGTVLHVFMDFCDILLPLAKMFRYLSFTTLCDLTFVLFLVSWLITRQIGLAFIIYTSYVHAPQYIPFKWSPATGHFMSRYVYNGFVTMEILLLGLATTWFFMACRVAVRVIRGLGAEDSRSDDEDPEEKEDGSLHIEVKDESATPSLRNSPASSISDSWADPGTPKGVQAVSVGGSVPEVLKGLQCKRDEYKREEVRRRK